PLPQRIVDARLEAALLLLVADLQPELDELDAGADDVPLELGAAFQEALVLLVGGEAHHALDAGAVVPAAVEDQDLAGRGEVRQVALHVELGLLAVGRGGQRHHAEDARADALGEGLDRAALAGRVAALEEDDDAQALVLDPGLEVAELRLELPEL